MVDLEAIDPDLLRQIEPSLEGEPVRTLLVQPLSTDDKVCASIHARVCEFVVLVLHGMNCIRFGSASGTRSSPAAALSDLNPCLSYHRSWERS